MAGEGTGTKQMKAYNIIWDIDKEDEGVELPTEIEIPAGMTDEDEISDYISDETGYCQKGFLLDNEDKCPFCGGNQFVAHQVRCIDIVVNARNEFLCYNTNDGAIGGAIYGDGEPLGPYICTNCGAEFADLASMEVNREPPKGDAEEPYSFLYVTRDAAGRLIRVYRLMNHDYQVHLAYDGGNRLVDVRAFPTAPGMIPIISRLTKKRTLILELDMDPSRLVSIDAESAKKKAAKAKAEIKKLFM